MTEPDAPHILVVDDARDIREPLGLYLRRQGLRVTLAADAAEAREILASAAINLVMLDVMMPGESGLSLCKSLAREKMPVILLTARVSEDDRVAGLDLGADDYVTKPFSPRELLARIQAVLRRTPARLPSPGLNRRRFAGLIHDPVARMVTLEDNTQVTLTSGESHLLVVLLDHAGEVLSRMQLLDMIKGREARAYDRAIDNTISRLRRKISDDTRDPRLIVTEWGGGYRLAATVEALD